jgi:hypothetical protein
VAGQSITFDFLTTGADRTASGFRKVGDNTVLAARGAKVLADVIGKLGEKENRTAAESVILAKALRQTGDAEDRVAARAVVADAAIRRLDDAMQDSTKHSGQLGKALSGLKLNPGLVGPALLLAPAMTTLAGAAAAAGAGLGGAFIAGGAALAAFGAVAKPILSDAKKAADAVGKAQDTYNTAISNGVPVAKAYKAEQLAIAKAYAGMSPAQVALSRQLGDMADAWDKVKAAETPVVTGALQPWLKSVTGLTKDLAPIIAKISPVIASLGGQFNSLVNSSAFKGFRDFIGSTGAAAVSAGGSTIIDLVKSFMILLPKFDPLIREAVGWISRLGPAVLTWASSKKASDDITKFMQWFSQNGPVVGKLLKNIGAALAALAPGLTAGAATELNIISGFLGFIAKLPPSIAKPLAEVAGAALILSKMGGGKVISFLVTGTLGGIFGRGGVAGSAAQAGGALGLWAKLFPGATVTAAGALGISVLIGVAAGAGLALWVQQFNKFSKPPPPQQQGPRGTGGAAGPSAASIDAWKTYDHLLNQAGIDSDNLRTKNLTPLLGEVGKVSGGVQGLAGIMQNTLLAGLRAAGAKSDDLRTRNLVPLRGEFGKVSGGVQGLQGYINHGLAPAMDTGGHHADSLRTRNLGPLRGELAKNSGGVQGLAGMINPHLTGAINTGGQHVNTFRTNNLGPLRGELAKDSGGVQGLQGLINGLHGKTVHVNFVGSGSGSIAFKESIPGVTTGPSSQGLLGFHAAGGYISGGTPGRDSVLGMLMPGEVVVPTRMVNAGAVDHLRGQLPGFAAGGAVNVTGAIGANGMFTAGQPYMANTEAAFGKAVEGAFARAALAKFKKDAAAALVKASQPFGPLGDSGARSGSAALAQAFARSIMGQYHWGPEQWPPWLYLGNQESGWNAYAVNASSGAYGIGQSLGHGHPYNLGDYKTQVIWMANYIRGRYVNPANAWAHERAFNWYGEGGLVPGFASGGQVASQGRAWLKAWQTRHGGGYGAAWGPKVLQEQIPEMAAAVQRAKALSGARGLSPGQHRFWASAAADETRRLGVLHKELTTERAWRTQLGVNELGLDKEIRAAGNLKSLAGPVKGWKAQLGRDKATVAAISKMLGYSDAYIKAHPAAKPGPALPAITHTTGAVTDVIEAFLQSHAAPFGAARGGLVMDQGGWLKPGWNPPMYNGLGRPEPVGAARGAGGGTIVLQIAPGGGSEFDRFMVAWLRKHVHVKGGGSVQAAFGAH